MLERDILVSDVFIHKVLLEMCQEKRCTLYLRHPSGTETFYISIIYLTGLTIVLRLQTGIAKMLQVVERATVRNIIIHNTSGRQNPLHKSKNRTKLKECSCRLREAKIKMG